MKNVLYSEQSGIQVRCGIWMEDIKKPSNQEIFERSRNQSSGTCPAVSEYEIPSYLLMNAWYLPADPPSEVH